MSQPALGKHAFVADGSRMAVIDVSTPASPELVGQVPMPAGTSCFNVDVAVSPANAAQALAHIPNFGGQFRIFDVTVPSSPQPVTTLPLSTADVEVSGNLVYLGVVSPSSVRVFDISNPVSPEGVGTFSTVGIPISISLDGSVLVVSNTATLMALDVSNPASITQIDSWIHHAGARLVTSGGGFIATGDNSAGAQLYILGSPTNLLADVADVIVGRLGDSANNFNLNGVPGVNAADLVVLP